jgi:hypothetical protein
VNDPIGQAEQELGQISNKGEAEAYHRRWLGVTGALRSMAAKEPGFSHYYRRLHREWQRSSRRQER